MQKLLFLILLLASSGASAQQANFNYLGSQGTVTIATAQTFVNPVTLPQTTGRQSCWLQYQPASRVLTTVSLGLVVFGATPGTTANAFVLTPFQFLNCEQANEVEGGAVWITSTQTGDTFTIKVK